MIKELVGKKVRFETNGLVVVGLLVDIDEFGFMTVNEDGGKINGYNVQKIDSIGIVKTEDAKPQTAREKEWEAMSNGTSTDVAANTQKSVEDVLQKQKRRGRPRKDGVVEEEGAR